MRALRNLAEKIGRTLAARGIRVLRKEQLDKKIPWLRAGEETLIGHLRGSAVTVRDAFFFEPALRTGFARNGDPGGLVMKDTHAADPPRRLELVGALLAIAGTTVARGRNA